MSDSIKARHMKAARLARAVAAGVILLGVASPSIAGPTVAANSAFDEYASQIETRLAEQHREPSTFLSMGQSNEEARLAQRRDDR